MDEKYEVEITKDDVEFARPDLIKRIDNLTKNYDCNIEMDLNGMFALQSEFVSVEEIIDKKWTSKIKDKIKELEEDFLNPEYICPDCKFKGHSEDFDYDESAYEMSCNKCDARHEPICLQKYKNHVELVKALKELLEV